MVTDKQMEEFFAKGKQIKVIAPIQEKFYRTNSRYHYLNSAVTASTVDFAFKSKKQRANAQRGDQVNWKYKKFRKPMKSGGANTDGL